MNAQLIPKFAKVVALMRSTTHVGKRAAAESRATELAAAAGLTLNDAIAMAEAPAPSPPANIFAGFDDWCEEREPGYDGSIRYFSLPDQVLRRVGVERDLKSN